MDAKYTEERVCIYSDGDSKYSLDKVKTEPLEFVQTVKEEPDEECADRKMKKDDFDIKNENSNIPIEFHSLGTTLEEFSHTIKKEPDEGCSEFNMMKEDFDIKQENSYLPAEFHCLKTTSEPEESITYTDTAHRNIERSTHSPGGYGKSKDTRAIEKDADPLRTLDKSGIVSEETGLRGNSNKNDVFPVYPCTKCGQIFKHISVFNRHMRVHTGYKPYSCSKCKKKFSQSSSLNRHQSVHTGNKPFMCRVCGKTCTQISNLNRHACKP